MVLESNKDIFIQPNMPSTPLSYYHFVKAKAQSKNPKEKNKNWVGLKIILES